MDDYRILTNGLTIQWGRDLTPSSSTSMNYFPLTNQFTQTPTLFVTTHRNSNDTVQADMCGYYIDKTGFKTDYVSPVDYFAIGY